MSPAPPRLVRLLIGAFWGAALLCVLGVSSGASFYLAMRTAFSGREVTVPNVVNLPLDEARGILSGSDLYLETASERYDETVEKGRVQSQDPPGGATLKRNRKVRVMISLGPMEQVIPEVLGQTLRTAQITLQRAGIPAGHVSYTHTTEDPADQVLAQDPLPTGGEGAEGAQAAGPRWEGRVDLLVSLGPTAEQYVMPDLTHYTIAVVRDFADRTGLRVGAVRRERTSGVPRGVVIRQYPQAGYPVGRQDIISLVLSE